MLKLKLKCRDVDFADVVVVEDDHCPYSSCSHSHQLVLFFLMACALVLYHPSVCFL
jgi:hypothetical protein